MSTDVNDQVKVLVFVGTRKGGLILSSNRQRKNWQISDLTFKSWNVMHMQLDLRDGRLHAAVVHDVYGPSMHYSDDLGQTWNQASQQPAFPRPSKTGRPIGTVAEFETASQGDYAVLSTPETVKKVWNITPGRQSEPGVLYAGAQPAALFKSSDRGQTWELVESLYDHPHRPKWNPGAGGLCLHTILLHPAKPERMYVAISAGGCYRSDDAGLSWQPCNQNVRADFLPDPFPEYGQCVHKMAMHPGQPQVLYQQNHCGVYRSDNDGEDWLDIGLGKLPSDFGFPIATHPHEPNTVYIIPEDDNRLSPAGKFAVWRSRNAGQDWEELTQGLPQRAHLVVLREALATDTLDDAGVYVGTSTGQLFYSRDAGDHWELLADYLPPISSVEAAVIRK